MGPADGTILLSTTWEPWPRRSHAKVSFFLGERKSAERIASRFFRRSLELWEYAGLTGAPDDAIVEIGASRGMLYIEAGNTTTSVFRAHYYVQGDAQRLVIVNDGFHIHLRELQGCCFGLHVFLRQTMNASALGIHRIETIAGRRCNENGYYAWPRFGFDGELPERLRHQLPLGMEEAQTVLDLMESEQGRNWWRECGDTISVSFDLNAGSRSRAVLDRYIRSKKFSKWHKKKSCNEVRDEVS